MLTGGDFSEPNKPKTSKSIANACPHGAAPTSATVAQPVHNNRCAVAMKLRRPACPPVGTRYRGSTCSGMIQTPSLLFDQPKSHRPAILVAQVRRCPCRRIPTGTTHEIDRQHHELCWAEESEPQAFTMIETERRLRLNLFDTCPPVYKREQHLALIARFANVRAFAMRRNVLRDSRAIQNAESSDCSRVSNCMR